MNRLRGLVVAEALQANRNPQEGRPVLLERVKRGARCLLQMISPRLDYWAMSVYHAVKARLFVLVYPKAVSTGPRIILVAGEDGPDKLHVYAPLYTVYKTLRPHFNVELSVHASFSARHVRRIAQTRPDLVLLSADIGTWHQLLEQHEVPLMGTGARITKLSYDKVASKEAVQQRTPIATGQPASQSSCHPSLPPDLGKQV